MCVAFLSLSFISSLSARHKVYHVLNISLFGTMFNPYLIDADRSGKQCTGIYPAQLVGGRRLPIPQCIGTAPPDAQAAVGVCWYIPAGEDTPAEPPPEGARLPLGSITTGQRPVVSKCALREGRQGERSAQVIPRTLPLRFLPAGRSPPFQPLSFCHK